MKGFVSKHKYQFTWMVLGLLALFVFHWFKANPIRVEEMYLKGIFPIIRTILDLVFGWLPFPAVYLFVLFLLYRFWISLLRPVLRKKITFKTVIAKLLSTAGCLVFFFYVLWGWNYGQRPIEKISGFEYKKMNDEDLAIEYKRATAELDHIIKSFYDNVTSSDLIDKSFDQKEVRECVAQTLKQLNFPNHGNFRGRMIKPNGILLRWNTAGIYWPFVGEGHVDNGLLDIQHPSTMAHEMTHAFGVTDEASCNFVAYLACKKSKDPFVRLSGILGYWRYTAYEYSVSDEEAFLSSRKQLDPLVDELLRAIRKNNDRFPTILPKLRNLVYDNYLKSHGVAEGLRSYNRVTELVYNFYKAKH